AGTGFSWAPSTGADSVLVQMEPKVEFRPKPQDAPDRRVGGAETQVLRFQARKPGTTDLVLDYRRPWEKSTPPQRRFHLKVLVQ
ncbi:MAG: protease inhibitor I42 family protein, partial [Burkholderiales bacterium]